MQDSGQPAVDESKAFFAKVQRIQDLITEVAADQAKLRQLNSASSLAVRSDKAKAIQAQMRDTADHVKLLARTIKSELEALDAINASYLKQGVTVPLGSHDERVRTQVRAAACDARATRPPSPANPSRLR